MLVLSIARFWSIENSEYKIVGPCAHFGLLGVHQEYHTQVGQHVMFILLQDLDKSLLINKLYLSFNINSKFYCIKSLSHVKLENCIKVSLSGAQYNWGTIAIGKLVNFNYLRIYEYIN